jgi:protein N-terminal methyltransferase
MSHEDLITFLRRAQAALRPAPAATDASASGGSGPAGAGSLIFVKENCCADGAWGKGAEFLDPEDSSLTR